MHERNTQFLPACAWKAMEVNGYRHSLEQVPKQISQKKKIDGGVGNKRSEIGESS